ncbi:MAG: RAD55 family ATPase, partial [Candidatus Hodarchaeota archaeon]
MSWSIKGLGRPFDLIIPQGSASLIVGECGTGKTTLGIQFLVDGAKSGERGLLILGEQSERDSRRFFRHLNLETYIEDNKIVILDATKSKLAVTDAIPTASLIKSLRAEFNSTLVRVFEEIERKGVKRLVIDSLQSFLILTTGDPNILAPKTFSPIRGHIFKIVELCRMYGVSTLFISEGSNVGRAPLGFEEYIADSVLVLSKGRLNNRKIREITFEKIRGVRISQDTFLATMEGGRLRAFPPHYKRLPPILLQPEPVPDPSKDYISTGIE